MIANKVKLLIFNPEHDLCLANGSADFVPPQSAVDYARSSSAVMQNLYPDGLCLSAYDDLPAEGITEVVAWGWNATLKKQLQKAGIAEKLLPTDKELACWRALQHRQTILPLQPDARRIETAEQVEELLASPNRRWVLKAPWSGAGRGLHWIDGTLSPNDRAWLQKTVAQQSCVVAEPWRKATMDFALEYYVRDYMLEFIGYSIFTTAHGVYRENILLPDSEIRERIGAVSSQKTLVAAQQRVERWLEKNVVPHYRGPVGMDFVIDDKGRIHLCEMNLRHTMGMVAHTRVCGIRLEF